MVINKNIGGCLWNMIKNDDVAFYEREEMGSNNILWGCNISEKALTIISIDVKTAEGKINILNDDKDDKDEESLRADCSYFCGIDIDNENDYQRNVNFLSQRKKFYVKLKDSTIWVCEFDNGLIICDFYS